jgi:SNF2 family DNA or RNA helicase
MLKNKESKAYKAFIKIKTLRRICLTGTPFQNNLLEYYRMVSFVRPNLLGDSECSFRKTFVDQIQFGMVSDAPEAVKLLADESLTKLVDKLEPFIQRRDVSLLRNDLPYLQQVCLHVPPTKIQHAFYNAFRQHQEVTNEKNFLKQYSALRTIHNHPGTLFYRDKKSKDLEIKKRHSRGNSPVEEKASKLPAIKTEPIEFELPEKYNRSQEPPDADTIIEIFSSDEEEDDTDESYETNNKWWTKLSKRFGIERMKRIERYAIILTQTSMFVC